jgi:alpha-1,2-mannosyltransferase
MGVERLHNAAAEPSARSRASNWRTAAAGAGLLLAFGLAVALVARYVARGNPGWMYDANVYRLGARLVVSGQDLYPAVARHPFTYPPFAAIAFIALLVPPENVMAIAWTAVSAAAFGLAAWICLGAAGVSSRTRRLVATGAVFVLTFWLDPIEGTLLMGQVNLVLMALVVRDVLLPDGGRYKGLLTGLAMGIKLQPAIFVVYLLLTRRYAASARAVAAFAATVVVGFVLLPRDSLVYWGGAFLDSRRVGNAANPRSQSIASVVTRWLHSPGHDALVLGLDAGVAALTLAVATWAHRRGDELLALGVVASGMLLVSPITWQHHWVWVAPMLIWLARHFVVHRSLPALGALLFIAYEFLHRPYQHIPVNAAIDLHLGYQELVQSSTYAAAMVVFVATAAYSLIRARDSIATRRELPRAIQVARQAPL